MTNVVPFPSTAPVAEQPSDPSEERTFLHCSNCNGAHFVVEYTSTNRGQIRCGLAGCEQVVETIVWWEGA